MLLGGATATVAAAGALKLSPGFAQDATPETELHPEASPVAASDLPTVPPEFATETNWPVEGGNLKGTRVARGSSISTSTVSTLDVAWSFPVESNGTWGALVGNPVIVDGVVFIQTGTSDVFALKLDTGDTVWSKSYNQQIPTGGPNGLAVAYGMAFYAVGNSQVFAVDSATGDELWTVDLEGMRYEGIDMAPAAYGGFVYLSTIPGNVEGYYQGGQRGIIHVLDAVTGETVWIFDTVVDNLWNNSRVNSGGGCWHPPVFDDEGFPYFGIANASPFPGAADFPNGLSRPGANEYANNVLKIDPATGGLVWSFNVNPHDIFDLDNQLSPVLASYTNDGEGQDGSVVPLAITSGKHGYVVALDQLSGDEYWRTPVGTHQNDKLDAIPEGEEIVVFPGALGGVELPFAVTEDKVIVQANNLGMTYNTTSITSADFFSGTSNVVALDIKTGSILWDTALPTGGYGGITIANDVAFTSGLDGVVRGINIADGSVVWTAQTTAGVNTSFAISGDYLVVPSGGVLTASDDTVSPAPERAAAVWVYKLGGA